MLIILHNILVFKDFWTFVLAILKSLSKFHIGFQQYRGLSQSTQTKNREGGVLQMSTQENKVQ